MKIAIASENGVVSAHFGHCEGFTIYDMEDGKVKDKTFIPNPGHQPGFLPVFLSEKDVNLIIAGGMGERAQMLFNQNSIDVIVGADGECDNVLEKYQRGELKSSAEFCQDHHHD
jgi:predicted Fe-Mo cluster-binding NifX family protein